VVGFFERPHRKSLELEKCSMKFVKPLSQDDINQLKALLKTSTTFRIRQRAHAILLSAKRYPIDTLADIFDVDRDTMSQWINNWECSGIVGLSDHAKPGRPPTMSAQEEEQALKIILEMPQQVKAAIPKIAVQLGKQVSRDWVKRLLKKRISLEKNS
jgi:transposase